MLGTWKNWMKREIPLKYITVSDHLDILGVKLFGNFIETKAKNGEILIKKLMTSSIYGYRENLCLY